MLFVENQNDPTKHHHKVYNQMTCPQFSVFKQRLLNYQYLLNSSFKVNSRFYTKIHGKTIMVNKHKFNNKIIFNIKFITLRLHDIHVCHNQALHTLIHMKNCLACCTVSTKLNSLKSYRHTIFFFMQQYRINMKAYQGHMLAISACIAIII